MLSAESDLDVPARKAMSQVAVLHRALLDGSSKEFDPYVFPPYKSNRNPPD